MHAPELSGYDVAQKAREAHGPLDLWLSLGLARPGPARVRARHGLMEVGTALVSHSHLGILFVFVSGRSRTWVYDVSVVYEVHTAS